MEGSLRLWLEQVREYEPFIVVETDCDSMAGSKGFNNVAGYAHISLSVRYHFLSIPSLDCFYLLEDTNGCKRYKQPNH